MHHDSELVRSQTLEQAYCLPARAYSDEGVASLERAQVMARSWQFAGHVSQLAKAGDCLRLNIAGVPLLVLRDGEQLRALHDVCRHRAGPLQLCPGRGAHVLRCRYHGWTYDTSGQLIAAGEMHTAEDFSNESVWLPQASVAQRHGLVFVSLDPQCSLDELWSGTSERMSPQPIAQWRHAGSHHYELQCNWKIYVDNYLEGYHVPHIHPALNRLLDYRNYKVEAGAWHSLQYSPLQGADGIYADGEALYWFLYPNTMLNLLPQRLQTNRVVPLAVDRCRVEFEYYYPDDQATRERMDIDHRFADEVQAEDAEICVAVQSRMCSGSWDRGRLNPLREDAVHHFHELWRRDLRGNQPSDT